MYSYRYPTTLNTFLAHTPRFVNPFHCIDTLLNFSAMRLCMPTPSSSHEVCVLQAFLSGLVVQVMSERPPRRHTQRNIGATIKHATFRVGKADFDLFCVARILQATPTRIVAANMHRRSPIGLKNRDNRSPTGTVILCIILLRTGGPALRQPSLPSA